MKKLGLFLTLIIITVIILIATPAFAERLKYTGLARSEGGAVLASATVAVYLAGTTTPADVYEASSGGTSVNEVTTDSNGRWTFYADTTDYAFTQEYKVVVTKDGYSSITLDNIFILRLPTNAVGVLTNDGSGNYTWSASSFSESGDYSPTGTWDWSGATVSGLNATGLKLADDSTLTLPTAASTYAGGLLSCDTDGTCTWTDPTSLLTSVDLSTVTIGGGTASRMAEWDGSGNLTSADTATTGTGAPVKAVSPTLTSLPKVRLTNDTTNGTYGGTAIYFAQCAASMGFGQPAYIQSTGKPGLADADAAATMPAIGLVVVASTDADTPCTILTHGVATNTSWNWTPGATIYVADGDAGALTATVGDISDTNDVVQVVGIAIHADSIFVNPSLTTIVLE